MNIKDYVADLGLTFDVAPGGDEERVLRIARAGRTMETKVRLTSGPFDGERFLQVLRTSLQDIEVAEGLRPVDVQEQAKARAKLDALGPVGRVAFFKVRDDFRHVVGPESYRRLLDDVQA